MSRADKQRHLRQLVCEGCPRRCRYQDFRAHGRYAGGFAPKRPQLWASRRDRAKELEAAKKVGKKLPHGNKGKRHDGQQLFADEVQSYKRDEPGKWQYHRKGTVLGSLHATKMEMWKQFTESCPLWGTDGEVDDQTSQHVPGHARLVHQDRAEDIGAD
jgi:hypothetical protein